MSGGVTVNLAVDDLTIDPAPAVAVTALADDVEATVAAEAIEVHVDDLRITVETAAPFEVGTVLQALNATVTISPDPPAGGVDGDLWFQIL